MAGDNVMRNNVQAGPQRFEILKFPFVALGEEADCPVTVKSICRSVT